MSTEFITLDSRLNVVANHFTETKLKDTAYTSNRFYFLSLALNVFCLYVVVYWQNYTEYVVLPVLLFTVIYDLRSLYFSLLRESHNPTVLFKDVRDITTTPLDNGLETRVTLHLANGRRKIYVFRNAEKQLEGFLQLFDLSSKTAPSLA